MSTAETGLVIRARQWLLLVGCALVVAATTDAGADAAHVSVVRNRAEILAALTAGPTGAPRIIYVDGVIDANVDDRHQPLTCVDYYRGGYTREAFLAFYNPAGPWGPNPPANTAGSLEAARRSSAAAQSARIRMRVPDNTTIVGTDARATIRGAWLDLRGTTAVRRRNIIIRHLTFEDTYDCFPAWTPNRNADGTWAGSENVGQRAPRVRYGQVHVYKNYYVIPDDVVHGYSWGVGFQPLPVASGIGRGIVVAGTMHTGVADDRDVDPLADYNGARDPDLARTVGWEPAAYLWFDPTRRVPAFVEMHAGPFRW